MLESQALALSLLLNQQSDSLMGHDARRSSEEKVIGRNLPQEKREPKVKREKPIQLTPKPEAALLSLTLPQKGTLDAKSFLRAINRAPTRNEQIQAIAGFVGYDPMVSFGEQEAAARMMAQRQLRGPATGPTREEQRQAARGMVGYVKGVPDYHRRKLVDLAAREVLAVDAMLEHRKQVAMTQGQAQQEHKARAMIERERAKSIASDLEVWVCRRK